MNPKDLVGAKKAPLRYVPRALVLFVSAVMETGARKYGPFNWRQQPVSAQTYGEAIERHLAAWMEGQDNAEDSGLSHIAHIAASCGIILDAAANGTLLDDRVPGPAADILRLLDKSQAPAPAPDPLDHTDTHPDFTPGCEGCEGVIAVMASRMLSRIHADEPVVHEVTSEAWGSGDGPVYGHARA